MAEEKDVQEEQLEKSKFTCHEHGKYLVPLLCEDCDSSVCFDCIVKNHHGHKMCNISDYIEEKVSQLNEAVKKKESACFNLNRIQEKLQNRRQDIRNQKEQMLQRVIEREDEIVREVKRVSQETIDKIETLAADIENQLMKNEKSLASLMSCDVFRQDTDEECIKSLYFYNKLKMLASEYNTENQKELAFTFVIRDVPLEEIILNFFGLVVDDQWLSSDDTAAETDADNKASSTKEEEDMKPPQYQTKFFDGEIDGIRLISTERSLISSKGTLYYKTKENVDKLIEGVKIFIYLPKLDEVIFTSQGSLGYNEISIYRQSVSKVGQRMRLMKLHCKDVIAMNHDDTHYLIVLYVLDLPRIISFETQKPIENSVYSYEVGLFDDTGCPHAPILKLGCHPKFNLRECKIIQSSIVIYNGHSVVVNKGLTFTKRFSYHGSIGNNPSKTFSPIDLCADSDGNFLIIDSNDDSVHLLDPEGKFVRIIMSKEDGLCQVTCIAIDTAGWLWIGEKSGQMHFANYRYVKTTTREKRRLETIEGNNQRVNF